MPAFLEFIEIDWGWPALADGERAVVRRYEARAHADPGTHTLDSLTQMLEAASAELPGREIRARTGDEHGEYRLVASGGRCVEDGEDRFDEEGAFPDPLTADDYRAAGIEKVHVGLFWPEATLGALQAEAGRLGQSLSWLIQKAWTIARATATPVAAGNNALPRDGKQHKQSIYLPIDLYAELTETAEHEDRSLSFVVQRALATAWPAITALHPGR